MLNIRIFFYISQNPAVVVEEAISGVYERTFVFQSAHGVMDSTIAEIMTLAMNRAVVKV